MPVTAIAIGEVFGHGLRLTGIALEFDEEFTSTDLVLADYTVTERNVTGVFSATSTDPANAAAKGRFVIVTLDPEDDAAQLYQGAGRSFTIGDLAAEVTMPAGKVATTAFETLIADKFQRLTFTDPENGNVMMYNLFVPDGYDPAFAYPLVNFMHDASVISDQHDVTLLQGHGAIIWASPEEQAKRPCIVLAPQFASQQVDNDDNTFGNDVSIKNLIGALQTEYNIDANRIYTTGQSGGGMLSIAMVIKYPGLFAAAFLVACQWGADLVEPMKDITQFIVVATEDLGAFPGQKAITEALESYGTVVNRALWNGRWSAGEFDAACKQLLAEGAPVNFVVLETGTVIPGGASTQGAAAHMNTWPIAYYITGAREWLFAQSKT